MSKQNNQIHSILTPSKSYVPIMSDLFMSLIGRDVEERQILDNKLQGDKVKIWETTDGVFVLIYMRQKEFLYYQFFLDSTFQNVQKVAVDWLAIPPVPT